MVFFKEELMYVLPLKLRTIYKGM